MVKRLVAVMVSVVMMLVVSPPAVAGAVETSAAGATVTRVAGTDRVGTAVAISQAAFPTGAPCVLIASSENWPDALSGSALAGAVGGPILLTRPTTLPSAVADEVRRLRAPSVIVLGGTGAVSDAVLGALGKITGVTKVERIGSTNRYTTSYAIGSRVRMLAHNPVAFVATGESFPDALAAAPMAARYRQSIQLMPPQADMQSALLERIRAQGITGVEILGGTGALSASFEQMVRGRLSYVKRLGGSTRYDTAAVIATFFTTTEDFRWNGVAVASGEAYPDALTGGVMQGRVGAPLLLTLPTTLHLSTERVLANNSPTITQARIFGGTGAVSDRAQQLTLRAIQ